MKIKLENGIIRITSEEKTIARFEHKTLVGYFLDYEKGALVSETYSFAIVTTGGIIRTRAFGTIGGLDCLYYEKFTKALDSLLQLKGEEDMDTCTVTWEV